MFSKLLHIFYQTVVVDVIFFVEAAASEPVRLRK